MREAVKAPTFVCTSCHHVFVVTGGEAGVRVRDDICATCELHRDARRTLNRLKGIPHDAIR